MNITSKKGLGRTEWSQKKNIQKMINKKKKEITEQLDFIKIR